MAAVPPAVLQAIELDEIRRRLKGEYEKDPTGIMGSEDELADLKILNDSIEAKRAERAAKSMQGIPMDPISSILAMVMPDTYDNMANSELGNGMPAIRALEGMTGAATMVPGSGSAALQAILRNQSGLEVPPPKPPKNSLIAEEPDWMSASGRTRPKYTETLDDDLAPPVRRPTRDRGPTKEQIDNAELAKSREASEKGFDEGKWKLDTRQMDVNDSVKDADFVATPGSAEATQNMNQGLIDYLAKAFGEKPVETLGNELLPNKPAAPASAPKPAAKAPKSIIPVLGDLTTKTPRQLDSLQMKLETAMGLAHEALMESGIPNIGEMKFAEIARLDHPAAKQYVEVTQAQNKLRDEYTYRDNYHGSKNKVKTAR